MWDSSNPRHSVVRDTPRLVAPSQGNSASGPVPSLDTPGQGLVARFDPTVAIGASAYPPIADYGFLSDCETVALVAPNGGVEWMCLPRVDSPSVFGAMLDRDAGTFRVGPAGISVPASRRYLPGTMVLETSWWTGAGWIIVRDVLLIGDWHHETERSHTHRRAPTDYDADHVLLRTVRCVNGEVEVALDCIPAFDYGRRQAHWEYGGPGYHDGVASGRGLRPGVAVADRPAPGVRRSTRHRAPPDEGGRADLRRAGLERARATARFRARPTGGWSGRRTTGSTGLTRVSFPDHPWRSVLAAQRPDAQGSHLRADRSAARGRDDLAAGDTVRRAQLGLPL